mgnify:CR=1 FL=1
MSRRSAHRVQLSTKLTELHALQWIGRIDLQLGRDASATFDNIAEELMVSVLCLLSFSRALVN